MKRRACYTRKSIFSDKSESTKNQARMCKDYIDCHYSEPGTYIIYEDEGKTGANTDRPELHKLMDDIRSDSIDTLIVYQLDRLSRDVKDFSNIYAELEEHHVQFVSVKENIDTSTPIGKAMMYIAVVFAQMERETIAGRVYDNMVGLSGSGWWVGGNPPVGYRRKRVETPDGKKHVTIEPVANQIEYVKLIHKTFQENNFSLSGFETYLKSNNILTLNGKFFSSSQLYKILTIPYCVQATQRVYDYFAARGCIMNPQCPRELWDGKHGVMVSGRSTERNHKHELNPPEKWRICIGKHDAFIDDETWLKTQEKFQKNIFDKKMKYDTPLLKGIVRCKCGTLMSIARKKKTNGVSSYYYCVKRTRQGSDYCDMSQINIDTLDGKVMGIFKEIEVDNSIINKYASTAKKINYTVKKKSITKRIQQENEKIHNLAGTLSEYRNSPAAKYIIEEINEHDAILTQLNRDLLEIQLSERRQEKEQGTLSDKIDMISEFVHNINILTAEEKNALAKKCIKSCTWDGKKLFITF